MLQSARRLRLPTHIAAFSTVKPEGSVKQPAANVKPAAADPELDSLDLERRDPEFEAMSQVAAMIRTRPGGKQEMGNAVVTEETTRPRPTDRHTTLESGPDEEMVPVEIGLIAKPQEVVGTSLEEDPVPLITGTEDLLPFIIRPT